MMAALTAVFSWVSIPFYPVPMTLQTLAVLLAGGLLGPVWGPVSMLVYLAVGVAGAPVFSGGSAGVQVLLGPRGGFLLGFVLAAFVVGLASRWSRAGSRPRSGAFVLTAGVVVASGLVYVCGLPWLSAVTGMSLGQALAVVAPLMVGDLVKAAAAVALIRSISRVRGS